MTDPIQPYDSTQDTLDHISLVGKNLDYMIHSLEIRKVAHDLSKLRSPEKEMYDQFTPILKGLKYGSDEYKANLAAMGPALIHHYAHNSHHPEYFGYQECNNCYERHPLTHEGNCSRCDYGTFTTRSNIAGMSLLDIFEMLADWKAAGQRMSDGSIYESLAKNRDRFGISDDLFEILQNTVKELGW